MKRVLVSLVGIALVAHLAGCVTGKATKVSANGKQAFQMTLPKGWSSKLWKGKTILIPPSKYPHIQLWCVGKRVPVSKAEADIAKLVRSEVIKFKTVKSQDIKIAGAPGKLLTGKGLEADDQDPSNAKVFLFTVKDELFLLCIHGEGDEAAKMEGAVKKILDTVESID